MTPTGSAPLASYVTSGGLTLRDAVTATADVLIVFFIIYRALKLVRGTRAAQTMTGMALIIGLFFFAKRLDLITVSWLFEKLIDYFIIFFVVIFQQDIRRALMQVGQNLFMRRQYEETYVIEEVVQAAGELAKQCIGALIVIERDADLSDHLGEVGVELDAKVTKELLITLFIPEAANHMHDGAVIIRNLRVHQAGAVLPLSANTKLDKQLGTRHRAAIGVTEETDAVVVVVSEERGSVSLCFNGNIARDLEPATLRKALLGLFQKKKNNNKGKSQPAGRANPSPRSGDIQISGVALGNPPAHSSTPDPASTENSGPKASRAAAVPADLLAIMQTQPFVIPLDPALLAAATTAGSPAPAAPIAPVEPQSEPTIRLSAAHMAAASVASAASAAAAASAPSATAGSSGSSAADTQRTAAISANPTAPVPGASATLKSE
jgi:uncharacterized protein (TIGR00159 family)